MKQGNKFAPASYWGPQGRAWVSLSELAETCGISSQEVFDRFFRLASGSEGNGFKGILLWTPSLESQTVRDRTPTPKEFQDGIFVPHTWAMNVVAAWNDGVRDLQTEFLPTDFQELPPGTRCTLAAEKSDPACMAVIGVNDKREPVLC
ncbi:MAG: hypothetical protein AAB407_03030 [Patescibacteria group bacterium]